MTSQEAVEKDAERIKRASLEALEDKVRVLESRVLLAEEWSKKAVADREIKP